jgi:hypothetical protein
LRNEIDESEFEEGHEAVNPQEIENDFFNQNQIVRSAKIWPYIFDNLEIENIKKLMKSGLPYCIGPSHFRASGLLIMTKISFIKRRSFKRMIRRVEQLSTRKKRDFPKNKAFF